MDRHVDIVVILMCVCVFPSNRRTSHKLGRVQRNHYQLERQVESSSGPCPELQDHLRPHIWRQEPDCKSHSRHTHHTHNSPCIHTSLYIYLNYHDI